MSVAPSRITALLFTPGNRMDRFPKAAGSGADGVIIDWEDAVAPDAKESVRTDNLAWLVTHLRVAPAPFLTGVRVNHLRSEPGRTDVESIRAQGIRPDFVILPKVEAAAEVQWAAERLPAETRLLALIETVRGVRKVLEIATSTPRLTALAFGGLDLSAETGGEPSWDALLTPRTQVVHACAEAGLTAIDQPYVDFRDEAGLVDECRRVRSLGFAGKLAIHPQQCAAIIAAFQPASSQVELARRIVSAADAAGGGVVAVDGRMIDQPLVSAARRLLANVRS
ncbi:MAG TPA: CoA ester lyase [Candidatus Didemnitutus sp.]|nr:CoA ester lyase [Candidatus Didemnitutus sp.]